MNPVGSLKKTAGLICFLLILTLASSVCRAPVVSGTSSSITITRVAQVYVGGLVVVNDTVTILNNSSSPLSNLIIGFPANYLSNLIISRWKNGSLILPAAIGLDNQRLNIQLNVSMEKPGFYGIDVKFPRPISLNQEYKFTLTSAFSRLIVPQDERTYNLTMPTYPALAQNTGLFNVTVVFPAFASLPEEGVGYMRIVVEGKPAARCTGSIKAYSNEILSVKFTYAQMQLLECPWATRNITIDPWGAVHVSDTYYIKNIGKGSINRVDLQLAKGFSNATTSDAGGTILQLVTAGGGGGGVVVNFRMPIRSNEFYTFTVDHTGSASICVKQLYGAQYMIDYQMFSAATFAINKLSISISLPEGAECELPAFPQATVTKTGSQQTLTYELVDATPIAQEMDFKVKYQYNLFFAASRPILLFGIIIALIGGVLILRREVAPSEITPIMPIDTLKSFVEAHDEKTSLQAELESLESRLEAGKIKRHEYKWRAKDIHHRLDVLNRDLEDLKNKMKSAGGKYAEAVNKIEIAEAELEPIRHDLEQIEFQYRLNRISRETYETILAEFKKRQDKARATIDGIIIGLREELS